MNDPLKHTKRVRSLIDQGKLNEAAEVHNRHLKAEFARAQLGEVIELTDLVAAKEILDQSRGSEPRRVEGL